MPVLVGLNQSDTCRADGPAFCGAHHTPADRAVPRRLLGGVWLVWWNCGSLREQRVRGNNYGKHIDQAAQHAITPHGKNAEIVGQFLAV